MPGKEAMSRVCIGIPSSRHARDMGRDDKQATANGTEKVRDSGDKANTFANVEFLNEEKNRTAIFRDGDTDTP